MTDSDDLRWGRTKAGGKTHGIHRDATLRRGETQALCGQVMADFGPEDESRDYGAVDACGICKRRRTASLDAGRG